MRMKYQYLLFSISIITTPIGAMFKLMHWPYANILLIIGLIAFAIFALFSLIEIHNNEKKSKFEKLAWTLGFLFSGLITAILYIILKDKNQTIKNKTI